MLRPGDRLVHRTFGPSDFWQQVKSLMELARLDGRTYRSKVKKPSGKLETEDAPWLTYEEWDVLFESAVEHGIMAVPDDGKGNAIPQFVNPSAPGLLALWRAIGNARAAEMGPLEFARRQDELIEQQHLERRERERIEHLQAVLRREQYAKARRNGGTKRDIVEAAIE